MTTNTRSRLAIMAGMLGLAGTLASPHAAAQAASSAPLLAAACFNCHGTDGRSPGPIASIAGRPEAELLLKLKAFKANPPPAGTTVMNRLAKGYSDADLEALARHFSQIKAQPTRAAAAKGDRK